MYKAAVMADSNFNMRRSHSDSTFNRGSQHYTYRQQQDTRQQQNTQQPVQQNATHNNSAVKTELSIPIYLNTQIGKGSHGSIYKTTMLNVNGSEMQIAVKYIDHANMSTGRVELLVLKRLLKMPHKNIVSFIEAQYSPTDGLYLSMEFINGVDTFTFLDNRPGFKLDNAQLKQFVPQLLSAVSHLHSAGIAHCDIKPENIMIIDGADFGNFGTISIKLIDFGLAEIGEPGQSIRTHRVRGSQRYFPPEIVALYQYAKNIPAIRKTAYNETFESTLKTGFDVAALDVWAVGIMVYIAIIGRMPYRNKDFNRDTQKGLFPPLIWGELCDHAYWEVCVDMLAINPLHRITANDALDKISNINLE